MHDVLKDYSDYDVIGHFNVIDRYLYFEPDYNAYKTSFPIIEDLLRNIINNGKGIEINTSSYRYGMGEKTTPSSEILEMYKSLGGEILTIGADAHNPRDVGYGFDKAIALAKKYNFRYISTYKNRNVKMIKL